MAKKDYSKDIEALERSLSCYSIKKEDLTPYHLKLLSSAYGIYLSYYEALFNVPTDPRIEDIYSFHDFVDTEAELKPLIIKLRELNTPEEAERQTSPAKEESTIPQDLEGLVAQYRENQADRILNADKANSVEALVKRARQTWETRHRIELIQKNREEARNQSDKFFVDNIDPKAGDPEVSYREIKNIATTVIRNQTNRYHLDLSSAQSQQATEDLFNLIQTGAIDLDNFYELTAASEFSLLNIEGVALDIPLEKIDVENPYADDPKIDEEALREHFIESTKELTELLHQNPLDDFDENLASAKKKLNDLQHNLETAIPNAKLPNTPLQDHAAAFESAIRKADPTLLAINPTGASVRTAAVLETTRSQSREIGPEVVILAGLGLTPEKLDKAEEFAKNSKNANTPLGILYRKQTDVFDQVHSQLKNLHNSKLAQEIAAKPLSGLSEGITNTFNRLPPGVQNAARFALNPTGTINTWVNRQIGRHIGSQLLKNTGSALSQKLGGYLLKEGFANGVKNFVSEASKKLALEAAKKIGITLAGEGFTASLALALGIPTAGASLLIGIALLAAQETLRGIFGGVQKLAKSIYGEEIEIKDLAAGAGLVVGGAVATSAIAFFGGLRLVGNATKAAFISATGIIILTLVVIGLYMGMVFLVAPALSTLVQFDSVEKVNYPEYGGGNGPGVGGPGPGDDGKGVYDLDCGPTAGAEITINAGSYPVTKILLTGPGRTGFCITPTKITIHWSCGWSSNDVTYNTLIQRGLSCQIGTDQNGSVQQWQQMWEKKAELAYCTGGNENNYCLNNEMVGAWFIPPGTAPTRPEQRAPSEDEIQSSVNSTCFMMKQYKIPYTQIFGHYQLMPGKPDPGVEFLEYFINRVKQQCP